ncbi:hypothetical protein AB0Y04_01080 [Loigolactobacillus coryniformis]|uniref:hypothetical protein n=1 Tax=Loigolactobacillus coryniformis TaxID=1610 RepID=UPI003F260ED1
MSFLEFAVFFVVYTYSVYHHFWLDADWIAGTPKAKTVKHVGITRQQSKVFNEWVRGVTHDKAA